MGSSSYACLRDQIKPTFQGISKPQILEILKLLPRNNCRQCGQTTCIVFSLLVVEGVKGPEGCPGLNDSHKTKLQKYLEQFYLEPWFPPRPQGYNLSSGTFVL